MTGEKRFVSYYGEHTSTIRRLYVQNKATHEHFYSAPSQNPLNSLSALLLLATQLMETSRDFWSHSDCVHREHELLERCRNPVSVVASDAGNDSHVQLFNARGVRWKRLRAAAGPAFSTGSIKKNYLGICPDD
ncbi:hypothetical protein KIN20_008234 [Parelaphostrongylus tenuis]|uniref:Uncharacterized protein n=1 Tax=Parelaphostrongylus tenuis TaxID=148309 RepID=A0AAD5QIQ4_PARTN|nr:hypothetical protein KIN20_008234 [Parelaphostrongylus tenuis]